MQKCETQDKTVKHNERNTMSCKYWRIHREEFYPSRKVHSKQKNTIQNGKSVKHNAKV